MDDDGVPLYPNEAYAFSELIEQFNGEPLFAIDVDPRDVRISELEEALVQTANAAGELRQSVIRVVCLIGLLLFVAGVIFGGILTLGAG